MLAMVVNEILQVKMTYLWTKVTNQRKIRLFFSFDDYKTLTVDGNLSFVYTGVFPNNAKTSKIKIKIDTCLQQQDKVSLIKIGLTR